MQIGSPREKVLCMVKEREINIKDEGNAVGRVFELQELQKGSANCLICGSCLCILICAWKVAAIL
jgi:hypothetical protein